MNASKRLALLLFSLSLLSTVAHAQQPQRQCIPASVDPSDQPVETVFAKARADLEAKKWEDAAIAFRYLTMHHADADVGARSAPLYLQAIDQILERSPQCFDDIARDVPRIRERYCSPGVGGAGANTKNAATCTLVTRMQVDVLRVQASNVARDAAKKGDSALYAKSAALYMDVFNTHCQEPLAKKQPVRPDLRCDEIIFNAAHALQSTYDPSQAIAAYRTFLRFDAAAPKRSGLLPRVLRTLAGLYQATARYVEAAEQYERFALLSSLERESGGGAAEKALSDATILRIGVGQIAEATKNIAMFRRLFGAQEPVPTAQLVLALASVHEERGEWNEVRNVLDAPTMSAVFDAPPAPTTTPPPPLDLRLRAHAVLANANANAHVPGEASKEYAKVRSLWGADPRLGEREIRNAWKADDQAIVDRRLAKALNSIGDALLFLADEKRLAAAAAAAAAATPVTSLDEKSAKDWYEHRLASVQAIEVAYLAILDIQPFPPVRPVIQAKARIAALWAAFADELLLKASRRPLPRATSEAIRTHQAKAAAKSCIEMSVKYQFKSPEVDTKCLAWLEKNFKTEVIKVDELVPSLTGYGKQAPVIQLTPFTSSLGAPLARPQARSF